MELCLRKDDVKKKCQVTHSSSAMDSTVGLANRVSSRKNGFASSEAVLLTNIFSSAI